MVVFWIGFIFGCILLVGGLAMVAWSDAIDGLSTGFGVILSIVFALFLTCAFIIFDKTTYYEKYNRRIEDIKEYRVDTTFVTTNGITDTTYTFYFNGKENED